MVECETFSEMKEMTWVEKNEGGKWKNAMFRLIGLPIYRRCHLLIL